MNLVERVKNIVLTPQTEWQAIAGETATVSDLYKSYIVPLAAIGPVASFFGMTLIGVTVPFMGTMRLSFASALTSSVLGYAFSLVGVFILSLIIDALAPTFKGEKNPMQALKVATYAYTPAWVASVLQIVPMLGILTMLISLYCLYLLYLGLPVLMKSPKDRAVPYTVVVVICAIVLSAIFAAVVGSLGLGPNFGNAPASGQMHMR